MTDKIVNVAINGNGFKVHRELFLAAAESGGPFRWNLAAGARGVQLATLAQQSSDERRRVDVPAPADVS